VTTLALKIAWTQARDALRSRWIAVYTAFFLIATEGLLRFSGDGTKAVLSLSSATLVVVPLVTLVLSTIYVYDAREFTELLLAQPIRRSTLFSGLYLGLAVPMAASFVGGIGLPILLRGGGDPSQRGTLLTLLIAGVLLTFVFTAIAFAIALWADDRLRALGAALGLWFVVALLYDGIVLTIVAMFSDYPIERALLGATFANPVDLARILILLRLDVAALMGYTGAVFQRFFGGTLGIALALSALATWVAAPVAMATRQFRRKDF
jgi:Cu-processing system permease protein